MKIYERLQKILDTHTQGHRANFGRLVEIHPSTLHNYLSEDGQRRIKVDFLRSLSKKLNINLNWLITGRGEIYNDAEDRNTRIDTNAKIVGSVLGDYMHDLRLTSEQLAEAFNCSAEHVDKIIQGRRQLSLDELEILIKNYRIDANTLLARVGTLYLKEQTVKNEDNPYYSDIKDTLQESPEIPLEKTFSAKLKPRMFDDDGELTRLMRRHEIEMKERGIDRKEATERAIKLLQNELEFIK